MEGIAPIHPIRPHPPGVVGADEGDGGHPEGQAHVQGAAVVGHQEAAVAQSAATVSRGKRPPVTRVGPVSLAAMASAWGRSPAPLMIRSGA